MITLQILGFLLGVDIFEQIHKFTIPKRILARSFKGPKLNGQKAGAYPSFISMKHLGVLLLPLDGMLVHRSVTPAVSLWCRRYPFTPGWRKMWSKAPCLRKKTLRARLNPGGLWLVCAFTYRVFRTIFIMTVHWNPQPKTFSTKLSRGFHCRVIRTLT